MSKYEPLMHYLESSEETVVELSFAEIERIIHAALPESASTHRAFWSNNPTGHAHAQAWLSAGYESESVDIDRGRVVFRRNAQSLKHLSPTERKNLGKRRLAAIQEKFSGTVHIPEGVDIMEPIELEWDAMKD